MKVNEKYKVFFADGNINNGIYEIKAIVDNIKVVCYIYPESRKYSYYDMHDIITLTEFIRNDYMFLIKEGV